MSNTQNNNNDYIEVDAQTVSSTKVPSEEELKQESLIKTQQAIQNSKLPEFVINYLLFIGRISQVDLYLIMPILKATYFITHFIATWTLKIIHGICLSAILFVISCLVIAISSSKILHKIPHIITNMLVKKPIDIKPIKTYNVQINIPN